jgi:hypothetical protein
LTFGKNMRAATKIHVLSASYCALLVGMNWFRSVSYSRTAGVTAESFSPVALAVLVSGSVACYLVIACFRLARARLENGRKVGEGKWIRSWIVVAYALPLLWRQSSTSISRADDGATVTMSNGYGHALSIYVFTFAVVGLLLFQILNRLRPDDTEPNKAPEPSPEPVTDRADAPSEPVPVVAQL